MREVRACAVHVLLDGDHTPRDCGYCEVCGAWMCEECRANFWRRVRAAGIHTFEEFKRRVIG